MKITRRRLIEAGGVSALSLGVAGFRSPGYELNHFSDLGPDLLPESQIFPFASKAVDAAIAAGATYADVRIIRNLSQSLLFRDETIGSTEAGDRDVIGFGVRALVNGCFGFAASPYVDMEEAGHLAKAAVEQAKASSDIRPRKLDWAKAPAQKGRWISPGEDPFLVPIEERVEFINAWREEAKTYRDGVNTTKLVNSSARFSRIEKFIVTSEGTAVSQVVYITGAGLSFVVSPRFTEPLSGPHVGSVGGIAPQQGGWEVLKKANPREQIPRLVTNANESSRIGVGTFDVGRYDLVLTGNFVGRLVSDTFGKATQLDLALGYEANADGTSYLGPDVGEILGTQVAHPSVSIKCERSGPAKLATIKWDDEGVAPQDFDLIQDGVLVNYQCSREHSSKLNEWSNKSKVNKGLQGCANAQSGLNIPLQSTPNMVMSPNASPCSVTDMISEIKRGYLVYDGSVATTFGVREGFASPTMAREIRDGKLRDFVMNFEMMFSTPEIWKNITMTGDSTTMRRSQGQLRKGEPVQTLEHSVDAPAISVKDVPLIDPTRKA